MSYQLQIIPLLRHLAIWFACVFPFLFSFVSFCFCFYFHFFFSIDVANRKWPFSKWNFEWNGVRLWYVSRHLRQIFFPCEHIIIWSASWDPCSDGAWPWLLEKYHLWFREIFCLYMLVRFSFCCFFFSFFLKVF